MATAASTLLLQEAFEAGDDRFLDEVLASDAGKKLKALAERWYKDDRPAMRAALLRYVDDGCDRPHHRPLVKALFKLAEKAEDDEVMGHFMVAFDRLIRRTVKSEMRWSYKLRTTAPTLKFKSVEPIAMNDWRKDGSLARFTVSTRRYLQRRAFRYFRDLAHRDVDRYGRAARATLVLYRDEHLTSVANVIDAWGLMHVLYYGSPVLRRTAYGVRIDEGRALSELSPAPFSPEVWTGCFNQLLELVERAGSRTVRTFSIQLLERDYAAVLANIPFARLRPLLRSPHDEVQEFAAKLLSSASGIATLEIGEWLSLLRIDNPLALPILCELFEQHVSPDRLDLAQAVSLACLRPAPVAELGLRWAKKKLVRGPEGLSLVLGLAKAEAPIVRKAAMEWVTSLVEVLPDATPEMLRDLLDSRYEDVRAAAIELFLRSSRFRDETLLWAALSESPYDDARAVLVSHLKEREKALSPEALRGVWITVLLNVHRGGKAKRAALSRIAERVTKNPSEASALLPLLGVALRSVRPAERRAALGALAQAAYREPSLRAAVARELPELRFEREEVA